MSTQQIPQTEWVEYFEGFSAHNQTRCVTLDVQDIEAGPQRVVDHLPLLAIEPDTKNDVLPSIVIVAGDSSGGQPEAFRHEVMKPTTVWIKQDDQGEVEAMDIEGEDGKVILQFCAGQHE